MLTSEGLAIIKNQLEAPMLAMGLHARGLASELAAGISHDPSRRQGAVLFREPKNGRSVIQQAPAARTFYHLQ